MRKIKRIIAMLLVAVLLVNLVPVNVYATPDATEDIVDNNDVTIEGINGFGNLLSEDLQQYRSRSAAVESAYAEGYTVTDLVIELNSATVTYESMEEVLLIVALYTEDGRQLLQSAETLVQPEESMVALTFEGEMPQYFYATAYMVDVYDLSPLCPAYETPMYTKEMQELLASTVDDYDADRVLNLDDDDTTNFAVYADATVVIEAVDGTNEVVSADDESASYVIENADEQITGLREGQVFVYPYTETELLIVKVKNISVSGTTVTITGDELEMEEVFSYVKIENEGDTSDMVVNEGTGDEDITYVGIANDSDVTYSSEKFGTFEDKIEKGISHEFNIQKTIAGKSDGASVSISGTIKMSFDVEFEYYISLKKQFMNFKADIGSGINIGADGSVTGVVLEFPDIAFTVAGVSIGFEPKFQPEFSVAVSWECKIEISLGFSYENKKGFKNLCKKPKVKSKVNFEGKIFLAIDLNPNISALDDVAEVGLSAPIGIEVTGELAGSNFEKEEESAETIHGCKTCIKGAVWVKFEVGAELELLKGWKKFSTGSLYDIHTKACDFHYSFDYKEFDFGTCPHYNFRLTITVKDENENLKEDILVMTTKGSNCGKTNEHGVTTCYLPEGSYTLFATIGTKTCEKDVELKEARKVVLQAEKEQENHKKDYGDILDDIDSDEVIDYEGGTVATGKCGANGSNVSWTVYEGGLLRIQGSGAMDDYYSNTQSIGDYRTDIKKVIVGSGVTHIASCAFSGCENLTIVELPETVTSIGFSAFSGCASLTAVNLPKGITSIEDRAFEDCKNLESIVLPQKITGVSDYTFSGCTNLQTIEIPASVTCVGAYAFCLCINLTSIRFDGSVSAIGENAFFRVNAIAHYPAGNTLWTADIMQNYGGTIQWNAYPVTVIASVNEENAVATCAVYGGKYNTEEVDELKLKTASFTGLVPEEEYLLLALVSLKVEDPFAADNLLYVKQAAADKNGNLSFQYIQRVPTDLSYVIACGPSNKNLKDAKITFPTMYADEKVQAVNPNVVYDNVTLKEGKDYVLVGTVDYTTAGTYQCYVRGIRNYTGLVACTYTVKNAGEKPNVQLGVARIYGDTRYETSFKIADAYKERIGVSKFNTVIIACGTNFADALAGSYLASVNNAPILMYNNKPGKANTADIVSYVNENLASGGKIYLLGGTSAVGTDVENAISAYNVKRLGGENRYDTNLAILDEAGVGNADILVCTGQNFADSLSGSAVKKPILLVNNKKGVLTDDQKAFLGSLSGNKLYVIGGTSAVSENLKDQLKAYGNVERIGGANRYETSVLLAEKFFETSRAAVLALGKNFPDGLCGGMLAISMDSPLILTISNQNSVAADAYAEKYGIENGAVLGGPGLIKDETVRSIFNMEASESIIVK